MQQDAFRAAVARFAEPYPPPEDPDGTIHVTVPIPMTLSRRISRYLKSRDRKSDVPTEIGVAVADLVSIGLSNLEEESNSPRPVPMYAPAPEEIAARCREVQSSWKEKDWKERRRSRGQGTIPSRDGNHPTVQIPVYREVDFLDSPQLADGPA